MQKTIEISETDYKRLQKIAEPFVDTPATAFSRVLDHYARHNVAPSDAAPATPKGQVLTFGIKDIPSVIHTKLLAGHFNGHAPAKINWDGLMQTALGLTFDSCGSVEELHRLSGANVVQGKKETDGYKYLPSQDFSYQGSSADGVVAIVVRCAKALGHKVHIEFEWRNKDKAYRPGKRAVLSI